MRILISTLTFAIALFSFSCNQKSSPESFIFEDINNFWQAYDKITTTTDSSQQLAYLQELFLDKASPGQKAMIQARNYSAQEYLDAINNYPKFWGSIRTNMLDAEDYTQSIIAGLAKLRKVYPAATPATVYFTVGAFHSPGTVVDSMILIGSEFAFGNNQTVTSEFPASLAHLKDLFANSPIDGMGFLGVHEFIHTQQNEIVHNLLCLSVYEGIAEFIADKMTPTDPIPAIPFGKANEAKVKAAFEAEMYTTWKRNQWIWNNKDNQFGMNDLAYYIGYAIAERNYDQATDKDQMIRDMIKLDYTDDAAVEKFVDGSAYFSAPLAELYQRFETSRPRVTNIREFANGSQDVDPNLTTITVEFSTNLQPPFNSTGLGELGRDHFPTIPERGFNQDGISFTYNVELEANKQYQLLLENGFRTSGDVPLKPYLIDFKTAER